MELLLAAGWLECWMWGPAGLNTLWTAPGDVTGGWEKFQTLVKLLGEFSQGAGVGSEQFAQLVKLKAVLGNPEWVDRVCICWF